MPRRRDPSARPGSARQRGEGRHGGITVGRAGVGPFSEDQVRLLGTFADQAVIAIENTRLFEELQARTTELAESPQRQTAASEVLSIISGSPGELQPVFEAILANATRICEAKFGTLLLREADAFRAVATHNAPAAYVEALTHPRLQRPPPDLPLGRVASTRQVAQIADITEARSYIERHPFLVDAVEVGGYRTVLAVPMLKDNDLIGSINILRQCCPNVEHGACDNGLMLQALRCHKRLPEGCPDRGSQAK